MNQPAGKINSPLVEDTLATSSLSLRVVDTGVDQALLAYLQDTGSGRQRYLVYMTPLDRPRIRSTLARRLRLKDSLAGNSPSRNAGILARDPHFWDYLQQINLIAYDAEIDARRSRQFINRVCRVDGRYELDREAAASRRFFTLIEHPFLDWLFACDTG